MCKGWKAKGSGNQEGLPRRKEGALQPSPCFGWSSEPELLRSSSWPGNHTCKGWSQGQVWRDWGMRENPGTFTVSKEH